jgi:predicted TPR repeat methyltransferase
MTENQKSYDAIASDWDNFRKNSKINKCIVDFVKYLPKNGTVLDLGCGTGFPVDSYLENQGFIVTGVDFSNEMIKRARNLKLEKATLIESNILDFRSDHSFDGIIAFDSLFHIPLEKQQELYRLFSHWLKLGGHLIFTHGKVNGEVEGQMFGRNFRYSSLDVSKVKELLKSNGFDIELLVEDYKEISTGTRDLLIVATKIK